MKLQAVGQIILAAVVAISFYAAQTPAGAQEEAPAKAKGKGKGKARPTGPTPMTPDGHPNLNGIWGTDRPFVVDIAGALPKGEELPLNDWAKRFMKDIKSSEDPEAQCLPTGVPRLAPYPMKYLVSSDLFVILFEGNIHSYRQIFLDRKEHPKNLNPSWYGDSIGHWEGDALVVDSVGFNDRTWFDFAGHPHTEQLHTVERFRRPDLGMIEYKVTITDPGAYTRPFTLTGHFFLQQNGELMEYICNENNRDVTHLKGFEPPTLTDGRGGANAAQ